jgi:hypothetical protein
VKTCLLYPRTVVSVSYDDKNPTQIYRVLKHRAPLVRGPIFLPRKIAMDFFLCGAILNLKSVCPTACVGPLYEVWFIISPFRSILVHYVHYYSISVHFSPFWSISVHFGDYTSPKNVVYVKSRFILIKFHIIFA